MSCYRQRCDVSASTPVLRTIACRLLPRMVTPVPGMAYQARRQVADWHIMRVGRYTLRNQVQENASLVQPVLEMWFVVFDSGGCACACACADAHTCTGVFERFAELLQNNRHEQRHQDELRAKQN
eukprot:3156812-Rhodomonas_salina.1